ncbi:hypothetical protein, conserved [Plasmodium gonderi]|uniref:Uncharacterized protein n=1 Tax=Plasmodium gonderi TaxID=77519 RepID=A0A1Y1JIP2_PLAGO|nr:hypothetical protein, conserved [Plasmodium gonderi]GAW80313.1 hypothetical protein, conserved [Plasmodium gonderi]
MESKEKKKFDSAKEGNLSAHEKFDRIIDEYYSDLKENRKKQKEEINLKTGDYFFKSVQRDKSDYSRLDENDEPPPFTDLVENEAKIGTVKITNPLPKVEKRDKLKDGYMQWLKTEKLMRPNERRLEYEQMQQKYLETIKLSEDIKRDVKLARVIKSHYPRGIVGVDSIYNENTVLYKDKYKELKNKQEVKEKKMKERGEALENRNNINGNFLAFETDNK